MYDYTYTGSNLLETYADTAGRIAKYTYGTALISQSSLSGTPTPTQNAHSVITDYQNSVIATLDPSTIHDPLSTVYAYDPFGKVRYQSNNDTTQTLGWLGRQYDSETGNNYLINRYYNADRGSFLSPDRYQYVLTTTPFTFNLYQYGYANPLVNVDPEGLYTHDGKTLDSSVWARPTKTEQEYAYAYGFKLARDSIIAIIGKEKFDSLTQDEQCELGVQYLMKILEQNNGKFFTIVKENDKDPGTALTRLPWPWMGSGFDPDKILSQFHEYQEDLKQIQMGTVPYYVDKSIRYAGPRLWKGLEQFSAMAGRVENKKLPEPELQRKMNLFMRNKLHIVGACVSFSAEDVLAIEGLKASVTLHFYIDEKGNKRILPTIDSNIFLPKKQRITLIKKLKEYATTSSVYGGSEQVGGTQGLIFADPRAHVSDVLLRTSWYGQIGTPEGALEYNKGKGYAKIGFAIPMEGRGLGISGGRVYSIKISEIPTVLREKSVQKELFLMAYIWML